MFDLGQDQGNDEGGGQNGGGTDGNGESEGLPPSIARAWRTFDVAKQIEYETKEQEKAEKARLQKTMRVFHQTTSRQCVPEGGGVVFNGMQELLIAPST